MGIIELSLSGAKPRVSEQDKVIQVVVTQMLQETHGPVSDRDYKYHMEQIALIRLGNLLKPGTLTFHKYNTIKQQHVQEIKEALRNFEVDGYDWNTDIFTRLDFHIGIKERPSEADPMVIYGPEDDLGDQERKERDKVRDHFPDRERKQQEEEKIVITPANVSLRGKKVGPDGVSVEGPEEDLGDQERKERDKVRDHFPDRDRHQQAAAKIVIKPANVSLRGKKPGEEEDEDEDGDDTTRQRNKVKDHFPEREKKVKEEEKIVIKPANVSLRDKKKEEEEEKAKKEKEAKEAAEKARKEKEAKDAAEK